MQKNSQIFQCLYADDYLPFLRVLECPFLRCVFHFKASIQKVLYNCEIWVYSTIPKFAISQAEAVSAILILFIASEVLGDNWPLQSIIILYRRVLCGVILFLCLVGTVVDIAVSFMKSHFSPVNKSDGFMPIRGVSIATDHDQAPHGQNPFAKSTPDSDHSPLLHSSPEVNFSTGTTLSSFHQEPAKPSEFAGRVCVLHSRKWTCVRTLEVAHKLKCFTYIVMWKEHFPFWCTVGIVPMVRDLSVLFLSAVLVVQIILAW